MNYVTVYDAIQEGVKPESYFMLVVWVIACILVAGLFIEYTKKRNWFRSVLFLSIFVLFAGFGGLGFMNSFGKQSECQRWLASGDYIISKGVVENFDPMPRAGHKHETFNLGAYKFSYSDFDLSNGCFNNARSHGGPIYENREVRLYHKNGIILRIEVKK